MLRSSRLALLLVALALLATRTIVSQAAPLGTAFTYQGRLVAGGAPVNGTCDFQFALFEQESGGVALAGPLASTSVVVSDGLFTSRLDFGPAFDGSERYLEIAVRCPAGSGPFATLTPRQPLTPAPGALYSASTPWSGLSGMPAGFADGVDDNTTYAAGTGLALSGTTLSADTSVLQARVASGCPAGSSIRTIAADGSVTCESDDDTNSGGTLTALTAGSGLLGGGTSGAVSLSADTSVLQARIASSCPAGSSIRAVAANGTVTCESDDDTNSGGDITAVTAGSGLSGGGSAGDVAVALDWSGLNGTYVNEGQPGSISGAMLQNDAVDASKIGARVPQLIARQGGNPDHYALPGTTTYTPGSVIMQAGAIQIPASGQVTVTFPQVFSGEPLFFITGQGNANLAYTVAPAADNRAGMVIQVRVAHTGAVPGYNVWVNWLAIGPE